SQLPSVDTTPLVSLFSSSTLYGDHRALHSFPTRRSSDLHLVEVVALRNGRIRRDAALGRARDGTEVFHVRGQEQPTVVHPEGVGDRKSTRLNSSHGSISYAVFCLKKKKKETHSREIKTQV